MKRVIYILGWAAGIGMVVLFSSAEATGELRYALCGGCCIGAFVLLSLWHERLRRAENVKQPIVAVEASVCSRRMTTERAGKQHVTRYWLTFRTEDGKRLEFNVSQLVYEDFDDGEAGPLRYRGWEFLSFGVKDKSDFKPMAPLPEEYEYRPGEPKSIRQRIGEKLKAMKPARTASAKHTEVQNDSILTHELDE